MVLAAFGEALAGFCFLAFGYDALLLGVGLAADLFWFFMGILS